MQIQVYHLPIDWRRAKFYLDHPRSQPVAEGVPTDVIDTETYFLPTTAIADVIPLRNWLHNAALRGRYSLYGCYERVTSSFRGIVFVFENSSDRSLFDHYCQDSVQA